MICITMSSVRLGDAGRREGQTVLVGATSRWRVLGGMPILKHSIWIWRMQSNAVVAREMDHVVVAHLLAAGTDLPITVRPVN